MGIFKKKQTEPKVVLPIESQLEAKSEALYTSLYYIVDELEFINEVCEGATTDIDGEIMELQLRKQALSTQRVKNKKMIDKLSELID